MSCLYLHGQMQAQRVVAFTWTDTNTASWLYLHGQMQALRAVAFTWNGRRQLVGCRYGCIAMRMVYNHDMRTRDGAMVRKTKG